MPNDSAFAEYQLKEKGFACSGFCGHGFVHVGFFCEMSWFIWKAENANGVVVLTLVFCFSYEAGSSERFALLFERLPFQFFFAIVLTGGDSSYECFNLQDCVFV